jgi:putative ABC transport system permease protein
VLLGIVGGAVGVLLALWLVDLLVGLIVPSLPRAVDIAIDGRMLLLTFGLSVLTGVIFGLVPALHASRTELNDALKETARSTAHARSRRARNALLVGEIAGALLLLFAAGLTLRSFAKLTTSDLGFRVDGLTVAQMPMPDSRYSETTAPDRYRHRLAEEVGAIPGVESVTVGAPLPFSNNDMAVGINPVGEKTNPALPSARYVSVAPNWFTTLGIPILRGRSFDPVEDTLKGPPALVVSKSFVERLWPGEDGLGKRVHVGICAASECKTGEDYTVVGVVGDIHHERLDLPPPPTMYTAFGHIPLEYVGVAVRSHDAIAMQSSLRRAILAVDHDLPPPILSDMRKNVSDSLQAQRVLMILVSLFAVAALILATIGIYGVISYTVTQRTREIGIRVALGAGTGEIVGMVVGESLRLSLVACVLGIGGALVGGRAMQSLIYGITSTDPLTIVVVTLLILGVCLLAALVPARRAARVDPMVALRYE